MPMRKSQGSISGSSGIYRRDAVKKSGKAAALEKTLRIQVSHGFNYLADPKLFMFLIKQSSKEALRLGNNGA